MDPRLHVPIAADELVSRLDAQDQGVCHEDMVNRDIHLVTIQVRREAGTEKPMARASDIQKKAGQQTSVRHALDLRRHGFGSIEPEIQGSKKWGGAQRVDRRRADQAMGSRDIPEGADELPGVRDAMELGGRSAGTLNGYHDQVGRPGQGPGHQCKI